LPHKQRTGLTRLTRYLEGRYGLVVLLLFAAVGEAAAQTGGWLLVRDAINNGVSKGDETFLAEIVVVYLVVQALGWVLMAVLIRGLASIGQGIVLSLRRDLFDHLTSLSLRYFSEQRAGWIIARLTSDVDALSDVLSQGLPTLVTNAVLLPAAMPRARARRRRRGSPCSRARASRRARAPTSSARARRSRRPRSGRGRAAPARAAR